MPSHDNVEEQTLLARYSTRMGVKPRESSNKTNGMDKEMKRKAAIVGGGVIGGGWAARLLLNGWDKGCVGIEGLAV